MLAFLQLDLVFQYCAKRSSGKNVSKMTYFVPVGKQILIQSNFINQ